MSKKKSNNYSNNKKSNPNINKQNNTQKNKIEKEEIVAPKVEVSKDGKKLVETTEFDNTFKVTDIIKKQEQEKIM